MINLIAKKKIRYIRDKSAGNVASVASPKEEFAVADRIRAAYYVKAGLADYAEDSADKVDKVVEEETENKVVTDEKKERKSKKSDK